MNIPQVRIQQTWGQISIQQDHGGVEIEQPKAHMEIKNTLPQVKIDVENGQLEINQEAAWAAYGIMHPITMTTRIFEQVRNVVVSESIAKIAQHGDRMAAIHQPGDAIAELAAQKSMELKEMNFLGAPSSLNVQMNYTPDKLNVELQEGKADITIQPNTPSIKRIPARVQIGMERYPSISIEWVGLHVDKGI